MYASAGQHGRTVTSFPARSSPPRRPVYTSRSQTAKTICWRSDGACRAHQETCRLSTSVVRRPVFAPHAHFAAPRRRRDRQISVMTDNHRQKLIAVEQKSPETQFSRCIYPQVSEEKLPRKFAALDVVMQQRKLIDYFCLDVIRPL